MSGKVYSRTVDSVVDVTDPLDRSREQEYCLVAHAHVKASNLQEAIQKIATHFANVGDGDANVFYAGHVTVRPVQEMHRGIPAAVRGVTH